MTSGYTCAVKCPSLSKPTCGWNLLPSLSPYPTILHSAISRPVLRVGPPDDPQVPKLTSEVHPKRKVKGQVLLGPSTGLQGRHRTVSGRNPASFGTGPPATRPESLTWPGTPPEGNPNNQNIREPGGRKTDRPSFNPFSHWQRLLTPQTPDHRVAPGKQVQGQGRGIHPAGAGTSGTAHAGLSAPGLHLDRRVAV